MLKFPWMLDMLNILQQASNLSKFESRALWGPYNHPPWNLTSQEGLRPKQSELGAPDQQHLMYLSHQMV
jgi:hypothetical protein